jgi:hypothetical protein
MVGLINTLAANIWSNEHFQDDLVRLRTHWLQNELRFDVPAPLTEPILVRLIRAAAILACSPVPQHVEAAYRIATSTFDLQYQDYPGIRAAAEVVLARMGNFPGLAFLSSVPGNPVRLPFPLAIEQLARRQANEIAVANDTICLTDFQAALWRDLVAGRPIGVSGPTSAGKSFVVQAYLRHRCKAGHNIRVVYVVPSRALISQVTDDIAGWAHPAHIPIISVPLAPTDPRRPRHGRRGWASSRGASGRCPTLPQPSPRSAERVRTASWLPGPRQPGDP